MIPFLEILLFNLILDSLLTILFKRITAKKKKENAKADSSLIATPKENEINEKSMKLNKLKEMLTLQIVEAEKLNAPRTFAMFSKMQRKNNMLQEEISKLEDEIDKIKQKIIILEPPPLKEESADLIEQLQNKYFLNIKIFKYGLVMVLYLFYKK